jgi:hypothetical protein
MCKFSIGGVGDAFVALSAATLDSVAVPSVEFTLTFTPFGAGIVFATGTTAS